MDKPGHSDLARCMIRRRRCTSLPGLGNPGREYENTRHNAGFASLDALAKRHGIELTTRKFQALAGSGYIDGQKVLLVKPQTYMNLSGESLRAACDFFKVDPEEGLIVIYDDISLAPGQLRVRKKGSAGGHNGIKNIIAQLGTQNVSAGQGRSRGKAGRLGSGGLCAGAFFKGGAGAHGGGLFTGS